MAEVEERRAVVVDDPCAGENYHPVKAWLCVVAALAFFVVGTGSLNMLNPVLRLMLEEWSVDTNMGSTWNSALNIVCAVAAFPVAWAMNKWGFRVVGYLAFVILAVTSAWGAMCDNAVVMVVIRALQGFGYVIPGIMAVYVVTQWFPKDKQQLPITIVALAPNLARIAVTQMSKPAIALGGWRMQWWFFLGLTVISCILFVFFMKPGPGYAAAEAERRAKEERKATQEKAPLAVVLKNPYIWAIVLLMVFYSMSTRGFDTFTNMILTENCGISNDRASDITSAYSMFKMASAPIAGVILSKFMKNRGKIIACILSVVYIGLAFGFGLTSEWQAWTFVAVVGVCACVAPYCYAILPIFSESPAILAMALTFFSFLGKYVTGFIAPYVVSFVYEAAGSFTAVIYPVAAFGILGVICAWFVGINLDKRTAREEELKASSAA